MIVRGLVRLPKLRLLAPLALPGNNRQLSSYVNKKYYEGGGGEGGDGRDGRLYFWGSTAFALGLGVGAVLLHQSEKRKLLAEESRATTVVLGERKEGLPEYSMEEVGKNYSTEEATGRIWVTYKDGVYDITDFVPLHPGSTKLLMAAGGSVEPFWAMYAVHLNNPTVAGLLEQYRFELSKMNTTQL